MPQISAATTLASDTVDLVGVEPTASSVQEKRSPIGTTDPFCNVQIASDKIACKLPEHCAFSDTRGTPLVSYYTLFKGWLPSGKPPRFFALPVPTRLLFLQQHFSSRTKVCRLLDVGARDGMRCEIRTQKYQKTSASEFNAPPLNYQKIQREW